MLHHVSDDPMLDSLKPYAISHKSFIRLLDVLESGGFSSFLLNESARQQKGVLLSFDDCPRHLWDFAIPELLRRGMKAAFYMPTAHLDGYNEWDVAQGRCRVELMNAAEIKELSKLGMEVGAHGHRHVRMGDISDAGLLLQELQLSRSILQEISGQQVLSMAYPFGSVPVNYKSQLKEAGFQYGLSIYQPWESRYALRRFIYHDGDTRQKLIKKLSLTYRIYRCATDRFK